MTPKIISGGPPQGRCISKKGEPPPALQTVRLLLAKPVLLAKKIAVLAKRKFNSKKVKRRKPSKIKAFDVPDGTPGAIRTRDLPLRRRTLYPAELRAHIKFGVPPSTSKVEHSWFS